MIKLEYVPNGKRKLEDWYGSDPVEIVDGKLRSRMAWYTENIVKRKAPYPMRLAWDKSAVAENITCHKHIADSLIDALEEIKDFGGFAWLKEHDFDLFGGIYNPRLQRGGIDISVHAWGIAIDYCPELGPWGEKSQMPWFIVDAFLKRSWVNLPHYDGMHFQACDGV